jgi:hypothetical protein
LALSMTLVQTGRISAVEWAASLGSAIKQAPAAGDREARRGELGSNRSEMGQRGFPPVFPDRTSLPSMSR